MYIKRTVQLYYALEAYKLLISDISSSELVAKIHVHNTQNYIHTKCHRCQKIPSCIEIKDYEHMSFFELNNFD